MVETEEQCASVKIGLMLGEMATETVILQRAYEVTSEGVMLVDVIVSAFICSRINALNYRQIICRSIYYFFGTL